jgi:hypothetical protein
MLPVSTAFREAVAADTRRVFGRVTIDYTDPLIDTSITATANEQANAAALLPQVSDALTTVPRRWASLDGSTLADGLFFAAPSVPAEGQMGWWGTQIAGAGGAFVTPFPTLTVSFASRPIHSLRVVGDSVRLEFPVDFEIRLLGVGGVLRHTQTITGNTLVDWNLAITAVTEVTQCVLEVRRWSHAGRQAKVLEFFTSIQETYEGNDILEISLFEERELAQHSLPVGNVSANEITLKLDNSSRRFDAGNRQSSLYELLRQNRRIRAWLGVELTPGGAVEYVPLGTFWSGEWSAESEKLYVSTTGRDRLELLAKSTYFASQVAVNQSLHALAVAVLTDAGLTASEYWVDPALQSTTVPNAWFGTISHREALRQIAEASLGQVYADRNSVVRVEGPAYLLGQETFVSPWGASTQSITITADNYFRKDTPVKWGELANRIEVETQPLQPVATAQEVFRSNAPGDIAAGQTLTLTVRYNEPPVIEAVASLSGAPAGATITATTFYAWGADVTVSSPTNAGTFTLIINGRPLRILNKERAVAEDATSIRDHGLLRYKFPENHLVQSLVQAQTIATTLLRLYRHPRRDLTMEWRGNPALTLGDVVIVRDHNQWLRYWCIRGELDFDGALSARLEGRMMR